MYDRFIGAPVHGNYGRWGEKKKKKKNYQRPSLCTAAIGNCEGGGLAPRWSRVPIDNVNYVIYEAGISLANANDRE